MARNPATTLKFALLFGIVILLGSSVYFLAIQKTGGLAIFQTDIGGQSGVKSKITNIRLTEKLDEGDVWELTAHAVSVNANLTEMENINMVYNSSTQGIIKLSSDSGSMQVGSQNATFKGNVQLRSPKPLLLTTEYLVWNADTRLLTTDKKVRIEIGRTVVNGVGLKINAQSQELTIEHSVKATFN